MAAGAWGRPGTGQGRPEEPPGVWVGERRGGGIWRQEMVDNKLAEKERAGGGGVVSAPGPGGSMTSGALCLVPSVSFLFMDGSKGQDTPKPFERRAVSKRLGEFCLLA